MLIFFFQKWQFSDGFSPVRHWCMKDNTHCAMADHLKVCVFNSEKDKNVHHKQVKLVHNVEEIEGISRKELLLKKRESRKMREITPVY